MKTLKIRPRNPKPKKYQVRFWSDPVTYAAFKKSCKKKGVKYMDAFNQFMRWYCE